MLIELRVQDFAIIDSVKIGFRKGLNVLSGETGAGKSIILKSLALLMGEKALADTVRTGAEAAVIEGLFDLSKRGDIRKAMEDRGLALDDENLIVRRLVSQQGKNRIYLNGSLSTLTDLKNVVAPLIQVTGHTAPLIEMTGQHESRHLLSTAYHLDLLDQYSGSYSLRLDFEKSLKELKDVEDEIERIHREARDRAQRLDFLVYQRDEIEALSIVPGEEVDLDGKIRRLRHASKLREFIDLAETELYSSDDSAVERIHALLQKAQDLKGIDANLMNRIEVLHQAKTLIEEGIFELRAYGRNLELDPSVLEESEQRLSEIRRLQKKYGPTTEDILTAHRDIVEEVERLKTSEDSLKNLENRRSELKSLLQSKADELHTRRSNGADLLEKGVNDELFDLDMKGVVFRVKIERTNSFTSSGASEVEFMIQSGSKDTPRALSKYASGGELSRIMLSLKRVIGSAGQPRTYLFDEVDTGVSGTTAEKVGRKLHSIAKGQQVICVTHLPQVAAFADHHYLIQKHQGKKGVRMDVQPLTKADRVKELARLISGEKITEASLDHARELLRSDEL